MDGLYNKHYIKVDSSGRVVEGWSDGPHPEKDTTDAICINEQGGYQFYLLYLVYDPSYELLYHHHVSEENPPLFDWEYMIPLYKYEGGYIKERTEEELKVDRAAIVILDRAPTQLDIIEAQVTYTALMTDTLL